MYELMYTVIWSGRRGSNSRHLPWQGNALPAELLPHYFVPIIMYRVNDHVGYLNSLLPV